MTVEKLLNNLSSPNEDTRKKAIDEIYGLSSSNPNKLTPSIHFFLELIRNSSDEYVIQYLGSTLSEVASSAASLGSDYFYNILNLDKEEKN